MSTLLSLGDGTTRVTSGDDTGESVDLQDGRDDTDGAGSDDERRERERSEGGGDQHPAGWTGILALHKSTVGRPQLERLDETTTEMATARDHRLHVVSATGRLATAGRLATTAGPRRLDGRGHTTTKMNKDWPATATTSKSAMALLAALASDRNKGTAEEFATTEDAPSTTTAAKDERRQN